MKNQAAVALGRLGGIAAWLAGVWLLGVIFFEPLFGTSTRPRPPRPPRPPVLGQKEK